VPEKRIYLRLGDKVTHRNYAQWGYGTVVEEMTSMIPGGTCLVRILFQDGHQRTFHNDLDTELCCYYFGVRKLWDLDLEEPAPRRRKRPVLRKLSYR
jgi:hypothetical protein